MLSVDLCVPPLVSAVEGEPGPADVVAVVVVVVSNVDPRVRPLSLQLAKESLVLRMILLLLLCYVICLMPTHAFSLSL